MKNAITAFQCKRYSNWAMQKIQHSNHSQRGCFHGLCTLWCKWSFLCSRNSFFLNVNGESIWFTVSSHPLLPVLDTRLCNVFLCLSWPFMMASCLCFNSIILARTSSSVHTSAKQHKQYREASCQVTPDQTCGMCRIPRGVSSSSDLAFKLAPLATSNSTIWI